MASTVPVAGSAYTYAYATMGEFIAWLIGWDLILEYMVGATTVAINWSGYVASFLHDCGIDIPAQFTVVAGHGHDRGPRRDRQPSCTCATAGRCSIRSRTGSPPRTSIFPSYPQVSAIINLPAMVIVALVTILLVIGIKESARVNNVIVFIKVSIVVLFIALGLPLINQRANWGGKFIPDSDEWFHYGWSGICRAAGVVFFAYIGFDAVSTTAQEAKNPQRDMPIGIIGSLIICTILYCLGAIVLTGVVNYKQLYVPDPVAVATDAMGMPWLSFYVKIGAIAGLSSVILVMLMSQPRIFYRWRKTACCRRSSARSIRGSTRRISRRSSPA